MSGIEMSTANYNLHGFADDREFILLDRHGKMITLRTHPQLYQLHLYRQEDNYLVTSDKTQLVFCNTDFGPAVDKIRVWKRSVLGFQASDKINVFFSEFLNEQISCYRNLPTSSDDAGFRDSRPILLINLASIRRLEAEISQSIDPLRFRPNIIIDDGIPFSEIKWKKLRFDQQHFVVSKPCSRCPIINIEPKDGKQSLNLLSALVPFTKKLFKVNFGQYLIPEGSLGQLAVGMDVQIEN